MKSLCLEPLERGLCQTAQFHRSQLLLIRGSLVLGSHELTYLSWQDEWTMILSAQTFVELAGARVTAAVTQCVSDGSSAFGQVLFSLTVSHYRPVALPEATVENIGALVRNMPDSVLWAHRCVRANWNSQSFLSCEAVCWLRVASASDTLLPLC